MGGAGGGASEGRDFSCAPARDGPQNPYTSNATVINLEVRVLPINARFRSAISLQPPHEALETSSRGDAHKVNCALFLAQTQSQLLGDLTKNWLLQDNKG
jgi:hypothetical protein